MASLSQRATSAVKRMTYHQMASFARLGFMHYLETTAGAEAGEVEAQFKKQRACKHFVRTNDFASRLPGYGMQSRMDVIKQWLDNEAMCLFETKNGTWVICHMDDAGDVEDLLP